MGRRMVNVFICSLFLNAACGLNTSTRVIPPTIQIQYRAVASFTLDERQQPIANVVCSLQTTKDTWTAATSTETGYIIWYFVPTTLRDSHVRCEPEGFVPVDQHVTIQTGDNEDISAIIFKRLHVDPMQFSLEQLSKIRGAMWTARLNLPYGPRPGQDSNILPTLFYSVFNRGDQLRILEAYLERSYTHAVTGPITGNDCYHGLYPCRTDLPSQAEWDRYLDELQEWWDRGIIPVYFAKPDGLDEPEQMGALDALYLQPRAQRLIRVVVYTGWEPWRYERTNAEWVRWLQRGQSVFPSALRLVHTVSDVDALTGRDDDRTLPAGQGNAISWQRTAPYLHGWLVQVAGYTDGPNPVPSPEFVKEFVALFDKSRRGSYYSRFADGYAGWPTSSAWGPGRRLLVYAAEYGAYGSFWKNWPESEAQRLGDLALQAGADGYLDGGTLPVR